MLDDQAVAGDQRSTGPLMFIIGEAALIAQALEVGQVEAADRPGIRLMRLAQLSDGPASGQGRADDDHQGDGAPEEHVGSVLPRSGLGPQTDDADSAR